MMKSIFLLLFLFGLSSLSSDERLIPFDHFFINVETNDWMSSRDKGERLNVGVTVSRSEESPDGSTQIDVNCFEFPAGQRMLLKDDLEAFSEAGEAANNGKGYQREVNTATIYGDKKTTYLTFQEDNDWKIKVRRSQQEAVFSATEPELVKEALIEAQAAKSWFEELLKTQERPEPAENSCPPKANNYHLSSTLGVVKGRGIDYEVSISSHSFGVTPQYKLSHTIRFSSANGGSGSMGAMNILKHLSKALDALERGQDYSFDSGEVRGTQYSVETNLKTKEADITLVPSNFFKDQTPRKGYFGETQLKEIRKLIKQFDEKSNWFQKNENLFFTTPNQD